MDNLEPVKCWRHVQMIFFFGYVYNCAIIDDQHGSVYGDRQ